MIKNAQNLGPNTPPEKYNVETAARGHPDLVLRAHIMAELLRNAQRWVRGYESPTSKAKDYGNLYDCLLLDPMSYPRRFASTPATYTNKKGEESKWRNDMRIAEVADWHADHEGLTIVDQNLNGSVHSAIKRLREDKLISDLIDCSEHQVMIVAEWHDPTTKLVIPLKCLIDIVPPKDHPVFGECLGDLKSTKNAGGRSFASDAMKFRYDLQGGFYSDMWRAATGEDRTNFFHIIQENFPPYEYRTPPPFLTQRFFDYGKLSYQAALTRYCAALASGVWPSYDQAGGPWPLTDCSDWFLDPAGLYAPLVEPEEDEDEEPEEAGEVTP